MSHSNSFLHAAKLTSRLDGDVVAFLVGNPLKKFIVHEELAKSHSEFVRLALRGEWKEASSRSIPLPDDESAVFSIYQQWLYSGLICTPSTDTASEPNGEYTMLVKAYILGKRSSIRTSKTALPMLSSKSYALSIISTRG